MPHEQPQPKVTDVDVRVPKRESLDTILTHEDDLRYLQGALRKYQSAHTVDRILLQMFSILSNFENHERYCRKVMGIFFGGGDQIPQAQVDMIMPPQAVKQLVTLNKALQRQKTVYVDEDTAFIVELISQDTKREFSSIELLQEKMRSQNEEMVLMSMQIEYLKNEKRKTHKEKRKRSLKTEPVEVYPSPPEETALPEPEVSSEPAASPFLLHGWDVLWTERFFSSEPQHLQPIATQSRAEAETDVEKVARGQISIPPGSIVRALEFYLRKDVIQKALTARNKYVPQEMKEWVKIKRGKDRIMLLVPDEKSHTLIFFAAGRDVIYRGL